MRHPTVFSGKYFFDEFAESCQDADILLISMISQTIYMDALPHSAGYSLFVSSFASSAFLGIMEQPQTMASDGSWGSFGHEMSVIEESGVMAQLFGSQSFDQDDQDPSAGIQELFWGPDRPAAEAYCSNPDNYSDYDPYSWQQQADAAAGSFLLHPPGPYNYEGCYSSDPAQMAPAISMSSTPMSFCIGGERIDAPPSSFFPLGACHQGDQHVCMNEETSSEEVVDSFAKPLPPPLPPAIGKRPRAEGREDEGQVKGLKRKARTSSAHAVKRAKYSQAKKAGKSDANEEERSNADMNPPQSSCCYSSEDDDSNASPEQKAAAGAATSSCLKGSADLSQNGKKRAGRGSATDPQSLYARKRRERINERLRILQSLVPNGTKVDISTMLEEAVQYVKFLELQIKLLSSDELWMYAPIAYNGMNLGFDLRIPPQSQQ